MGQCSKIVHLKEPFKQLGMSTKKIFDDMYIFLKELNIKNPNKSVLNELPTNTYEEISTQYWNLIYKDAISTKLSLTKQTFTFRDIEAEFNINQEHMFDFSYNQAKTCNETGSIASKKTRSYTIDTSRHPNTFGRARNSMFDRIKIPTTNLRIPDTNTHSMEVSNVIGDQSMDPLDNTLALPPSKLALAANAEKQRQLNLPKTATINYRNKVKKINISNYGGEDVSDGNTRNLMDSHRDPGTEREQVKTANTFAVGFRNRAKHSIQLHSLNYQQKASIDENSLPPMDQSLHFRYKKALINKKPKVPISQQLINLEVQAQTTTLTGQSSVRNHSVEPRIKQTKIISNY